MNQRFTIKKNQILRKDKEIKLLFEKGKIITEFPIKSVFFLLPKESADLNKTLLPSFKVMFIVPKKYIRKSARRNRIKRKMKESFRLLQHNLKIPPHHQYLLAFIYISKEYSEPQEKQINNQIAAIIHQLNEMNLTQNA